MHKERSCVYGKYKMCMKKSRHVLKNIKKKTQRQPKINEEYRETEAEKKKNNKEPDAKEWKIVNTKTTEKEFKSWRKPSERTNPTSKMCNAPAYTYGH